MTDPVSTLIARLAPLGGFRIWRNIDASGWYAELELPSPEGCTFKVTSDFRHPTAESALTQLEARLGEITNGVVSDLRAVRLAG